MARRLPFQITWKSLLGGGYSRCKVENKQGVFKKESQLVWDIMMGEKRSSDSRVGKSSDFVRQGNIFIFYLQCNGKPFKEAT